MERFYESMDKILSDLMRKHGYTKGSKEDFIELPPFKEFKDPTNSLAFPTSPKTTRLIDIQKTANADHKSILSKYKLRFKYEVALGFKEMKEKTLTDIQNKIEHISGLKPGNKLEKSITNDIKKAVSFHILNQAAKKY